MPDAARGVTRPHPRLVEVADVAVVSVLMKLLAACGVKEPIQKRRSTKDKQCCSEPFSHVHQRTQCRVETVGAAACRALVHLPEVRPINRALRWRSRIALRFWGSCPRCDREEYPHRKNHPEDESERFPCHVFLLASDRCCCAGGFKEEAQKNL
jgi:hypothetical protein